MKNSQIRKSSIFNLRLKDSSDFLRDLERTKAATATEINMVISLSQKNILPSRFSQIGLNVRYEYKPYR
jgi:hypothetical protein